MASDILYFGIFIFWFSWQKVETFLNVKFITLSCEEDVMKKKVVDF